jgi:hypothetical protein
MNMEHIHNKIINDEDIVETSLLFEPKRNTYNNYQKLDDHKINQLLETELLSDEKQHFSLSFNNNLTYLTNTSLNLEFSKKSKNKNLEDDKNEIEEKVNFKEERIGLPSENMKQVLEDLDLIKKEIGAIRDTSNFTLIK